jgi:hypothetical protein
VKGVPPALSHGRPFEPEIDQVSGIVIHPDSNPWHGEKGGCGGDGIVGRTEGEVDQVAGPVNISWKRDVRLFIESRNVDLGPAVYARLDLGRKLSCIAVATHLGGSRLSLTRNTTTNTHGVKDSSELPDHEVD